MLLTSLFFCSQSLNALISWTGTCARHKSKKWEIIHFSLISSFSSPCNSFLFLGPPKHFCAHACLLNLNKWRAMFSIPNHFVNCCFSILVEVINCLCNHDLFQLFQVNIYVQATLILAATTSELLFAGSMSFGERWGANWIPAFIYGESCREIMFSDRMVFCLLDTDNERWQCKFTSSTGSRNNSDSPAICRLLITHAEHAACNIMGLGEAIETEVF